MKNVREPAARDWEQPRAPSGGVGCLRSVCRGRAGGQGSGLSFRDSEREAAGGDHRAGRPLFIQTFLDHSYVLGAWGTPQNKINAEQSKTNRIHL